MRRLALAAVLTLALAGCGGGQTPRADPAPAETGPTKAQIAAQKLLDALDGDCDCTGEARARQRIDEGKAVQHSGSVVLTP
jgi:hypothetical protein